jgi:hypothetical protein
MVAPRRRRLFAPGWLTVEARRLSSRRQPTAIRRRTPGAVSSALRPTLLLAGAVSTLSAWRSNSAAAGSARQAGSGGKDHLPPEVRAEVERREAIRKERQGSLLCEVQVLVYERDVEEGTEMMVAFPDGAVLGVASDRSEIATAVARARGALASWR